METFWLICYDISDPKRLYRVAKALKPFGVRVQKSVFECWLTSAGLKTLLERMDEIIDPEIDSVRCYPLCESCRYLARTQGLTECKEPKNTFII